MNRSGAAVEVGQWLPPSKRRWNREDGRQMVRAVEALGETAAVFAQRHGLKAHRVERWLRRLGGRRSAGPIAAPRFAPVRLVSKAPQAAAVASAGVEVVIGKGRVVRVGTGFDEQLLRRVILVLEEATC